MCVPVSVSTCRYLLTRSHTLYVSLRGVCPYRCPYMCPHTWYVILRTHTWSLFTMLSNVLVVHASVFHAVCGDRKVLRQSDIHTCSLNELLNLLQGGVSGLMCSYNAVNSVPACANSWAMNTVARGDWGFNGYATVASQKLQVYCTRRGT